MTFKTDRLNVTLKESIITLEKEELSKGVLEQEDNIYIYDCKNLELKITTTKIVKSIRVSNPWENLKNILKL